MITEPPQIGNLDIAYPEAARKNGVEGIVKASFTLGEDGKVRDVSIENTLPFGVSEAVRAGLEKLSFKPAAFDGKPTAMKAGLEYIVTAVYPESDKNVNKPKITSQPAATYPPELRAKGIKGKVYVGVLFLSSGEVRIGNADSTMPKEFDAAALAAAKLIKFTPATHKKSKQPVSQTMFVEYDFAP